MKTRQLSKVEDLSIFSGLPCFDEMLHVGRPNIGDRKILMKRIKGVLDRKWLTNNGPEVQEFESRLKDILGVKHCIAVCNATVALELTIRALGMTGEVIVPSFTFIATAHALQWQRITPVFCDIDPATHCLNPASVEQMITPLTTGIISVHLWGQTSNIGRLIDIAQSHKLKLLFDAAHAFGCSYQDKLIGNFGSAEVFSFHATKFLNSFEGGAVATNDDELAETIRLMKNFGFQGYDRVIYVGTNGKMTEMSAAMGLTSLDSMGKFIRVNHANYECYRECLANVTGLHILTYDQSQKQNYQYIVVEVDDHAGLSRDEIIAVLHRENVFARRYFYPGCHQMEPYRSLQPHAHLLLPETERLIHRVMLLPNGTSIGKHEIDAIVSIIRIALDNADSVRKVLSSSSNNKVVRIDS